jgi:hypothetical protein
MRSPGTGELLHVVKAFPAKRALWRSSHSCELLKHDEKDSAFTRDIGGLAPRLPNGMVRSGGLFKVLPILTGLKKA